MVGGDVDRESARFDKGGPQGWNAETRNNAVVLEISIMPCLLYGGLRRIQNDHHDLSVSFVWSVPDSGEG